MFYLVIYSLMLLRYTSSIFSLPIVFENHVAGTHVYPGEALLITRVKLLPNPRGQGLGRIISGLPCKVLSRGPKVCPGLLYIPPNPRGVRKDGGG